MNTIKFLKTYSKILVMYNAPVLIKSLCFSIIHYKSNSNLHYLCQITRCKYLCHRIPNVFHLMDFTHKKKKFKELADKGFK